MAMPWVILSRIIRVGPGPGAAAAGAPAAAQAQAQEQHAAPAGAPPAQGQHAPARPDFILPALPPPRVTVLSAGRAAHPDPENHDRYPYIIAAGSHCLLAHFSVHPFHGTQFTDNGLHESNFVVVRDFHVGGGGVGRGVAERVPGRSGRIPILSSLGNVSLATNNRGDYQVAELQLDRGRNYATVIYFRTTRLEGWAGRFLTCPPAARDRDRIPHGAVHVDGNLWWFDLTWGILSCDASLRDAALVFHELPAGRGLGDGEEPPPHIRTKRCVTGSLGRLRYVEIIANDDGGGGAARVAMWTRSRNPDGNGWRWDEDYSVSFEEIWDDDSYKRTGLPRNVPLLVVVCPSDPHLVYFAMEQRIFGVNVPQHRVMHGAVYEPPDLPWAAAGPVSGRYLLACYLPTATEDSPSNAATTGSAPCSATNVGSKRARPPEGPEGGGC
ncbi:unnamed protein product [Urochloa decumbens]|uniref:DUF1618 domain-containing protein n=1 Tax=Urochloa decumbens TaxID=240449 RepID=A0ABC9DX53_9POAL